MKKVAILLFLLSCLGCNLKRPRPYNDDDVRFLIVNSKPLHNLELSNFIDSVSVLMLETNNESLLRSISKIHFYKDKVIVEDRKKKEILIFDDAGRYLHKISKKGRGPGEYISIEVANLDYENGDIYLNDTHSNKLICYSLEGQVKKEIKNFSGSSFIRDMIRMPDGNFLCYNHTYDGEHHGLWEVGPEGEFIRSLYQPDGVHPVVWPSPSPYLYPLEGDLIGFLSAAEEADFLYDGTQLYKTVDYSISSGTSVRELYGVSKQQFFSDADLGKSYTYRTVSQRKGNHVLSTWSNDNNQSFVTYFNCNQDNIISSYNIDFSISETEIAIPVYYCPQTNKEIAFPVITNHPDAFIFELKPEMLIDFLNDPSIDEKQKTNLRKLTDGKSEREVMEMNPGLQFCYVKK